MMVDTMMNVIDCRLLKPTVIFEPVFLAGAHITRATGFNAAFIRDNGIGIGARIVVIRSGDVIPKIEQVIERSAKVDLPNNAHWCSVDLCTREVSRVALLEHFVKEIGVKDVGFGLVTKLVDNGIDTPGKLVKCTISDLESLGGFQTVLATKVVTSVTKAFANATPLDLMCASNTFGRGVGRTKLAVVLESFPGCIYERRCSVSEISGNTR